MARYRVTRKAITQSDGPDYEDGDVWDDPPEAVLRAFSDRLERVEEGEEERVADAETDATITDEELREVLDGTNDEVAARLESGEYDEHLDRLEALERDGEDRKGAKGAIGARRED